MAKNKKGLNKDRTNDLLKDVEQVLETNGHITKDEIDALANQEVTVEEVTRIAEENAISLDEMEVLHNGEVKTYREAQIEQEVEAEEYFNNLDQEEKALEEIASEVEEQYQNSLDDREEEIDMNLQILNAQIKQAIAFNEGRTKKGIIGDQHKTIITAYEKFTGVQMSEEQSNYIKKINFEQAKSVIHTLNKYNKHIKSLNQQQLAGATN